MTQQKTKELLQRYSTIPNKKSKKAIKVRNDISLLNINLARKIAHQQSARSGHSFDDLFPYGFIGLIKAIERFDISKNNALSSFAVPYIRGEIQHYLRDNWGLVKIPRAWQEDYERVNRIQKKMTTQWGSVSHERIAKGLNIEMSQWHATEQAKSGALVIPFDVIPDSEPEDILNPSAFEALAILTRLERDCYLALIYETLPGSEICKKLKLPESDMPQWKQEISFRLKKFLKNHDRSNPNN